MTQGGHPAHGPTASTPQGGPGLKADRRAQFPSFCHLLSVLKRMMLESQQDPMLAGTAVGRRRTSRTISNRLSCRWQRCRGE